MRNSSSRAAPFSTVTAAIADAGMKSDARAADAGEAEGATSCAAARAAGHNSAVIRQTQAQKRRTRILN
ncbi:MAG: hypothetical protein AMXMBFR22_01360 [Phycisphaerae bacterium]